MRAFTGICATGMISQMFPTKMNENIIRRSGVYHSPSSPIVCRMMPLRTKSTVDSATFCTPTGTRVCRRLAMKKNVNTTMTDSHISRTTLLTPNQSPPKMIGHSTVWLIGGNSRARSDGITRLSAEA